MLVLIGISNPHAIEGKTIRIKTGSATPLTCIQSGGYDSFCVSAVITSQIFPNSKNTTDNIANLLLLMIEPSSNLKMNANMEVTRLHNPTSIPLLGKRSRTKDSWAHQEFGIAEEICELRQARYVHAWCVGRIGHANRDLCQVLH